MNHEQIEGFAALFQTTPQLTEIEVRHDGGILSLRRNIRAHSDPASLAPVPLPDTKTDPSGSTPTVVRAEHVGVVHVMEISEGTMVKAGTVLAQIETMRLSSDCKAPCTATLVRCLVTDGQPVEYGQPLFELIPEAK